MAAQSQTTVKALGLNINTNFLDLPNGSLVRASDVIIRRENVIESRRGMSDWSEGLGLSTDRAQQLIEYKGRILANYANKLAFDTGDTDLAGLEIYDDFAGTYTSPSQYRIRAIESNKNLYFTTDNGIKKISAASADDFTTASGYIVDAGSVKAIDFTAELEIEQGQIDGFLPVDSAVAYRIVWGYKDANTNLILGAPSARNVVYNFVTDSIVLDFNKLLTILDIIGSTATSLITETDFYSTLALGLNPLGTALKQNIIELCTKLDDNILYGDTVSAPLQISTIEMNLAGVVKLSFASGDARDYISVGEYVNLQGLTTSSPDITIFNGPQQVTSRDEAAGTFIEFLFVFPGLTSFAVVPTAVDATTTLNSYNYSHIVNSGTDNFPIPLVDLGIDVPITSGQAATIKDNVSRIVDRLAIEPIAVIPATLITDYIDPFSITESGNVKLQISIPTDSQGNQLNSSFFLQVYRSNVFEAFNQNQNDVLVLGVTFIPDDELHLIYEYFPTATDFSNGYVIYNDDYPDSLAQTNTPLYTNPITGDGILQSNDNPPVAKDIQLFKGYVFYANTQTKHIIPNLRLIGVDNIVSGDKITIANANTSATYTFVDGAQENTSFTVGTTAAINSTYFFINSANDQQRFYCWYNVDQTGTDPGGIVAINSISTGATPTITTVTDHGLKTGDIVTIAATDSTPVIDGVHVVTVTGTNTFTITVTNPVTIAGTTGTVVLNGIIGIEISVLSSDGVNDVAMRSANVLNNLIYDFTASVITDTFTVENIDAGLTTDASAGTVPSLTVVVNTQGDGEDAATGQVLISRTDSPAVNIDLTARSFIRVINRTTGSPIYAYYTSGDNTSPGQMSLESKVLSDVTFYVEASGPQFNSGTFGIGTSFSPDISPIHVVTGSTIVNAAPGFITFDTLTPHGLQNSNQVMITNTDCDPIADGVFTISSVTSTTFDVPHALLTTPGTTFSWELTSDSVSSTNTVKPNRVYYSKFNQPDAVPLLNYFDIGPEDKEILRIFPLRSTLFVFKQDGVYRISGEVAPFTVQLFDNSCILSAPDTVDVTDNIIFCWTTKGITEVNESGTDDKVSDPINVELLRLSTNPAFKTATWGVGYNSDNSYLVFTPNEAPDEVSTIGYRYSTLTKTWTTFARSQVSGIVRSTNDLLYMGSGIKNIVNQERKSFSRTDYADRDFELQIAETLVNSTGNIIQFPSVDDIEVGDVLFQDQDLTIYKFNALLQKLDLDPTVSDDDYFATLEASIGDNLRTSILDLSLKLDLDPGLTFTTYNAHITDKSGSITTNDIGNPTVINTSIAHELVDGRIVTISGNTGSIPDINSEFEVDNTGTWPISTTFTVPVSVTTGGGGGSYITNSNDFRDIKACFNALITMINNDPGATFSDYQQVTVDTPFEAVVIAVNKVTKKVTLNIGIQWIVGPVTVFKAIPCDVIYAPLTFGDVLKWKQLFQATVMFNNTAFTDARVSFSSDLKPDFISVHFNNLGNGIFGSYSSPGFGGGYFGGGGNAKPFRTLIPLQTQRCRFINLRFEHTVAREIYELYGITLTGNIGESERAYR